jgi:hypothetical protein
LGRGLSGRLGSRLSQGRCITSALSVLGIGRSQSGLHHVLYPFKKKKTNKKQNKLKKNLR